MDVFNQLVRAKARGMDGGMDGLLGVAGMIITSMDHSRKFPAFSTSKIFGAQMATGRFSSFFCDGAGGKKHWPGHIGKLLYSMTAAFGRNHYGNPVLQQPAGNDVAGFEQLHLTGRPIVQFLGTRMELC